MNKYETDNEALVNQFCENWALQDVEKLISYLHEDIEYTMWEGGPEIKGHDQFREQLSGFISGMKEVRWETYRSHAMGDIIINERTDYFIRPDGSDFPPSPFHIVGVFLVRDGKIISWKDYGLSEDDA
jgi:limonene-1,2-epoxide hydrolase